MQFYLFATIAHLVAYCCLSFAVVVALITPTLGGAAAKSVANYSVTLVEIYLVASSGLGQKAMVLAES